MSRIRSINNMHHIAIMKKSLYFLDKILSGEKTIESRWYVSMRLPWGKICVGDIVFFKNSGEPVTVKASVEKVLQFDNLSVDKINKILSEFGSRIGIADESLKSFANSVSQKKYCILVFLKNVEQIAPFEINKSGFGLMCAWICVGDVDMVKK